MKPPPSPSTPDQKEASDTSSPPTGAPGRYENAHLELAALQSMLGADQEEEASEVQVNPPDRPLKK